MQAFQQFLDALPDLGAQWFEALGNPWDTGVVLEIRARQGQNEDFRQAYVYMQDLFIRMLEAYRDVKGRIFDLLVVVNDLRGKVWELQQAVAARDASIVALQTTIVHLMEQVPLEG